MNFVILKKLGKLSEKFQNFEIFIFSKFSRNTQFFATQLWDHQSALMNDTKDSRLQIRPKPKF